jgi:hypothetical protein
MKKKLFLLFYFMSIKANPNHTTKKDKAGQGTLNEGEGPVQLTSLLM